MALNIKDAETERLAADVAALTGETKSGAIKRALQERRAQLLAAQSRHSRMGRLVRLLEDEVWPQVPEGLLGVAMTKTEREETLGYGPEGV